MSSYSIDNQISKKMRILSFFCTMLVIYRHSLNYYAFYDDWKYNCASAYVQGVTSMMTDVAVPFFFLISGFFFLNKNYYDSSNYIEMLLKKGKTLVIPFVFWNIISCFIYFFNCNNEPISNVLQFFGHIVRSDFYGPLWYIRDLLVFMILVPLYYWIFWINKSALYISISFLLFVFWDPLCLSILASVGILFFFVGGVLRRYQNILALKVPYGFVMGLAILWFLLSLFPKYNLNFQYRYSIMIVVGMLFLWWFIDFLPEKINRQILKLSSYSFFLYVTHFYVIKIIKIVMGKIFHGNDVVSLLTYLIEPILVSIFLVFIAHIIKNRYNTFYSVITGGR